MTLEYHLIKKPYPESPTIIRSALFEFMVPEMDKKIPVKLFIPEEMRYFVEEVINKQGEYEFKFIKESKHPSNISRFPNEEQLGD